MTQLDISARFPSEWVEISATVIFRGEEGGNEPWKRRIWKMGRCLCVCMSVCMCVCKYERDDFYIWASRTMWVREKALCFCTCLKICVCMCHLGVKKCVSVLSSMRLSWLAWDEGVRVSAVTSLVMSAMILPGRQSPISRPCLGAGDDTRGNAAPCWECCKFGGLLSQSVKQ